MSIISRKCHGDDNLSIPDDGIQDAMSDVNWDIRSSSSDVSECMGMVTSFVATLGDKKATVFAVKTVNSVDILILISFHCTSCTCMGFLES